MVVRVYTGWALLLLDKSQPRDEAVLEPSCQRSKGSQLYWGQWVCMCVGWCGSFHVLHLWQVAMKSKLNLEYHYGACASDYINAGMHGNLCCIWLVFLGSTAILFVLPNICKRFCYIYAYLHANQRIVPLNKMQVTINSLDSESNNYELVWRHCGKNHAHHPDIPWGKTHCCLSLGWTSLTAQNILYSYLSLCGCINRSWQLSI